mgnify:CR=1 FL=1
MKTLILTSLIFFCACEDLQKRHDQEVERQKQLYYNLSTRETIIDIPRTKVVLCEHTEGERRDLNNLLDEVL